ncbi:MAG: hypothetical protein Q4C75_07280 [Bergeyella zoohelcum]|nr:hypothetical protein [Bergeyella zoohelcum]
MFCLIFFSLAHCKTSDVKETTSKTETPEPVMAFSTVPSLDYFVGKWQISEVILFPNGNKIESHCNTKTYGIITKNNDDQLLFTKYLAKGKDCNEYNKLSFQIEKSGDSDLVITESDTKKVLHFQKISNTEFALISEDYIRGEFVKIKQIFRKNNKINSTKN